MPLWKGNETAYMLTNHDNSEFIKSDSLSGKIVKDTPDDDERMTSGYGWIKVGPTELSWWQE
jgi:hypothetical protein